MPFYSASIMNGSLMDDASVFQYLRRHVLWVRVALVCGDFADAGHDDRVLFLHHVSVLKGVLPGQF